MVRRLTAPWKIMPIAAGYRIETADGLPLAWVYFDDPRAIGTNLERLGADEARRVAAAIAQIPAYVRERRASADAPPAPGTHGPRRP